jgi:hypothetical protein
LSGNLQNTSNTLQTATYQVVPVTSSTLGSCVGATFTVNVGILPNAAVNNPLSQTVCSGVSFNIVPTHPGDGIIPDNTTYTWTQLPSGIGITGGITATNASVISGTLISSNSIARTATFSVSPTSPGGCAGAAFSVVITVNPFAYVNAMTRIFCDGVPFTITPTHVIDGVIALGTTFSWTATNPTGGLSGASNGTGGSISATLSNPTNQQQTVTYIVTPNTSCGPGSTFTVTVTINPDAQIKFEPLPADDPRRRRPDITKAQTLLNWEPTIPLQDGLKLMIEDFRQRFQK